MAEKKPNPGVRTRHLGDTLHTMNKNMPAADGLKYSPSVSLTGHCHQFYILLGDSHSPSVQKGDVKKEQLQGMWSSAFPNTSSELAKADPSHEPAEMS